MIPFLNLRLCETPTGVFLTDLPDSLILKIFSEIDDAALANVISNLSTLTSHLTTWNRYGVSDPFWGALWQDTFGEEWPTIPLEERTWRGALTKAFRELASISSEHKNAIIAYIRDRNSNTNATHPHPLFFCADRGLVNVCKLLVVRGADVNMVTENSYGFRQTPLLEAVYGGHVEVVQYFLEIGANPNFTEYEHSKTILMKSASCRRRDIVTLLLKCGATETINHQDTFGRTALHYAATQSNVPLAISLISFGANVSIKNKDGKTALELATNVSSQSSFADITDARKQMVDVLQNARNGESD